MRYRCWQKCCYIQTDLNKAVRDRVRSLAVFTFHRSMSS
nr:MAG TPA: hypothetical protein [Caudoviricetes sp.]